jgi:ABC-type oligopeptide transport system substrate-binding subunit
LATRSTWTGHLTEEGSFGGNRYVLTSWQHPTPTGQGILRFDRNARFWGKKPLLRRIEYTLYKDLIVEWGDFTQGKGDVGFMPAAQLAAARDERCHCRAIASA